MARTKTKATANAVDDNIKHTIRSTKLIQLGSTSPTLGAGTTLNVHWEDGTYGVVTVVDGPSSGKAGSVLSADYN